jgi:Transposase DDE domain
MVTAMPEAHKRTYRHPQYTTAYRVSNWREYDQALRDRGNITLWLRQEAIDAWTPPQTGTHGGQPVYSDTAIETAWSLRLLLHLPLRQTEALLHSLLTLMDVALPGPDHTTLSRRNATVAIKQQVQRASRSPVDLIIDSTGLQVCGQGEWHSQKHGEKKRKRWKKLHMGVDKQGWIVASCVTESPEHDPSQVPALLAQVDLPIARFLGDGIFAHAPVYAAGEDPSPGARVSIPPRQDAVLRPTAAISPTQRDRHLLAIESDGRCAWKRTSGYDAQSHAENAFSRCKRIFGDGLRAQREEAQERKASLACGLLNRMRELGRPQSSPVG